MRRVLPSALVIIALSLPLGGCVASLAASAAGMAIRGAQGTPESNAHLQPAARETCDRHAAQYGTVRIIDVAQSRVGLITVWGTVDDGTQRRSFECRFTDRITAFKLREIRGRS